MIILVRAPNWLGDCVLASAVVARLNQLLPEASLEVWVKPAFAPLFLRPFQDPGEGWAISPSGPSGTSSPGKWDRGSETPPIRVHALPGGRGLAGLRATVNAMAASRPDAALLLAPSLRAGLEATLAGIPIRVGYPDDHRRALLTHPVARTGASPGRRVRAARAPFTRHILEEGLELADRLADLLGAPPAGGPRPGPSIQPPREAWQEAAAVAGRIHPRADRPLIGFNPTSRGGATRDWPLELYASLIRAVRRRFDADLVLFGGPDEGAIVHGLAASIEATSSRASRLEASPQQSARMGDDSSWGGTLSVLAGQEALPLLTFAALAPRLDVLVTNDTGPMHLAAAMGARVVGIFGSTLPSLTGPVGAGHVVMHRPELACAGCYRRSCPYGLECLTGISVDTVLAAVEQVLSGAESTPANLSSSPWLANLSSSPLPVSLSSSPVLASAGSVATPSDSEEEILSDR